MCGISLIVSNNEKYRQKINEMNSKVRHRGPDADGTFEFGNVALGHTRLSIIDLDERSNQPFSYEDLVMSYNGEIYNYVELRDELKTEGYSFYTNSDTEVVLKSFHFWGERCFSMFNGMWAIIIYDKKSDNVIFSRDRFGIKPLYLYQSDDLFLGGSELKQFEVFEGTREINIEKVYNFIINSLVDYDSQTFYSGSISFPPGCFAKFNVNEFKLKMNRFYYIGRVDTEIIDLKKILESSVNFRLRSDVALGTCLSGGIDSSLIALIAREKIAKESKFLGIHGKSSEKAGDESAYAKKIADESGIELKITEPHSSDFLHTVQRAIIVQDEPFLTSSILMQYNVMKKAKSEGLKVLLDGQGADEIFLGYSRYMVSAVCEHLFLLHFGSVFKIVKNYLKHNSFLSLFKLLVNSFARSAFLAVKRYQLLKVIRGFDSVQKDTFFWKTRDYSKYDLSTGSLPSLLRYEDRNSMNFSIETRLPYLDFRLVEYALSLDVGKKWGDEYTKLPLRNLLKKYSLAGVDKRKDKIGFASPEQTWINDNEEVMNRKIKDSRILNKLFEFKKEISYKNYKMFYWRLFIVAAWEEGKNLKL